MRSVPEWIGKTDDTPVPPRVRLRVFEKYEGRCYLSGKIIRPGDKWHIEHIQAIANGGQNREGNLAPALVAPHKDKTRADRRLQARSARIRKRNLGIRKPSRFPFSRDSKWKRKVNGEVVER
jgi:5-methylcytosine-specific restriction protein A